jgi:RNA polymerase subunit RPABC4/transcription elongation factor Spt4
MAFCQNCGNQLADDAKFCSNCGTPAGIAGTENVRKQEYVGSVKKCPNCGTILSSDDIKCPQCGVELRNVKAADSITNFTTKLPNIPKREQAAFIENYPIPNTKEDFFEFLFVTIGHVTNPQEGTSYDLTVGQIDKAWRSKYKQLKLRAPIIFSNDAESLTRVNQIFKTSKPKMSSYAKVGTGCLCFTFVFIVVAFIGVTFWGWE